MPVFSNELRSDYNLSFLIIVQCGCNLCHFADTIFVIHRQKEKLYICILFEQCTLNTISLNFIILQFKFSSVFMPQLDKTLFSYLLYVY